VTNPSDPLVTTFQQKSDNKSDPNVPAKLPSVPKGPENNNSKVRFDGRIRTESESAASSLTSSSSDYTLGAPDGGWGWVVVAAAFFVNLIADGVTFSFTYLFQELEKEFGQSKAVTSFAVSMFHAVPLLVGPVASALTDRYGCRNVTIFGSVLASLGFFLSSFAPSLEVIYFTCGVVAGFGLSMPYVAAMVIVAKYFDERRSFAVGIACCGSGIGTLVFAEFIEFLLNDAHLTWRSTFKVLAGCFLFMCICGLFYTEIELIPRDSDSNEKPAVMTADTEATSNLMLDDEAGTMPEIKELRKHLLTTSAHETDELLGPSVVLSSQDISRRLLCEEMDSLNGSSHIRGTSSLVNFPTYLHQPPDGSSVKRGDDDVTVTTDPKHKLKRRKTDDMMPDNAGPKAKKSATADHLNHLKIRRQSLSYRRAMLSTARYSLRSSNSCPDIYRNAIPSRGSGGGTKTAAADLEDEDSYSSRCLSRFDSFRLPIWREVASWKKFCNLSFVLFLASNFILYAFYDIMYTFLPDYAAGDLKWPNNNLLAMIGIFNTVGELCVGWIGDKVWLNLSMFYAACMAVCGLCAILVPFVTHPVALGCISSVFGFAIAANYSLTTPIIVELVSIRDYCNAYGLLLLVQGVANLLGPPFAGWLYDASQEWYLTFGIGGAGIILSGLLLLFVPLAKIVNQSYCCTAIPSKKSPTKNSAIAV